jgi:hypothetical protein
MPVTHCANELKLVTACGGEKAPQPHGPPVAHISSSHWRIVRHAESMEHVEFSPQHVSAPASEAVAMHPAQEGNWGENIESAMVPHVAASTSTVAMSATNASVGPPSPPSPPAWLPPPPACAPAPAGQGAASGPLGSQPPRAGGSGDWLVHAPKRAKRGKVTAKRIRTYAIMVPALRGGKVVGPDLHAHTSVAIDVAFAARCENSRAPSVHLA